MSVHHFQLKLFPFRLSEIKRLEFKKIRLGNETDLFSENIIICFELMKMHYGRKQTHKTYIQDTLPFE